MPTASNRRPAFRTPARIRVRRRHGLFSSTSAASAALLLSIAGLALWPVAAHATNGYFSHGSGAQGLGQAGVGIAWGQDALSAATDPANTAHAFGRAVRGNGAIPPGNPPAGFVGGHADVRLKETLFGVAMGRTF